MARKRTRRKVVAYLRVSSKDKQDVGSQKLAVMEYAQRNGIKIDQIIYAKELEEPAPDVDPWKLIVTGAGIIAAATAALAVGIAQALLSDPALIVVVDDQWIQLHSWV